MVKQATVNRLPVIVIGGYTTNTGSYAAEVANLGVDRDVHFLNPDWGADSSHGLLRRKAAEVRLYMAKNGIQKADFVGHSIGATIAVALAERTPSMAGWVYLVNPVGVIGPDRPRDLVRRAVRSIVADCRQAWALGKMRKLLRAAGISIFPVLGHMKLRFVSEPAMMAAIDITPMLRGLKDTDVKVCLLHSAGDELLPAHRIEDTLGEYPFDLVDRWAMYTNENATHNAPIIEGAGVLREILEHAP